MVDENDLHLAHSPSLGSVSKAQRLEVAEDMMSVDSNFLDNNNMAASQRGTLAHRQSPSTDFSQVYGSGYLSLAAPFVSTQALNDLDITNKQVTTTTNKAATKTSSGFKEPSPSANYNWALWIDSQVRAVAVCCGVVI